MPYWGSLHRLGDSIFRSIRNSKLSIWMDCVDFCAVSHPLVIGLLLTDRTATWETPQLLMVWSPTQLTMLGQFGQSLANKTVVNIPFNIMGWRNMKKTYLVDHPMNLSIIVHGWTRGFKSNFVWCTHFC